MTDKLDHETYAVPVFVGLVRCEGTVAEYDTNIASQEQHYVALGDYLDAMASAKAVERERDEARATLREVSAALTSSRMTTWSRFDIQRIIASALGEQETP